MGTYSALCVGLSLVYMLSCVIGQSSVYFPGAVTGLYGYSYGRTAAYNAYARQLRRPPVVNGGYRGGALPVSGGYRGGPLPSGGYRGGIGPVDYYDDLDPIYDYYGGSNYYPRGYRSRGGRYAYHNYY